MLALHSGDPARAESDLSDPPRRRPVRPRPTRRGASAPRLLARGLSLGRPAEAAADSDAALRLKPGPSLERLRARVGVALGRAGGVALACPEEVAELPFNGAPLRADLLRLADRTRRALAAGSVTGDTALEARVTLAVALSALGDRSADAEADRALAVAPLSARVCLVRARVRCRSGRLAAATADVERAVHLDPDDPRAYELRGRLRVLSGDPSGGLADLDRALALGYRGASVRRERADVLMALGDPLGASRDWRQAIAHDPDDPRSYLGRARAEADLGHWDAALADLEQAAGWTDGRPGLGLRIALAYARCLPQRPQHLRRLTSLLRRVWATAAARSGRTRVGWGAARSRVG